MRPEQPQEIRRSSRAGRFVTALAAAAAIALLAHGTLLVGRHGAAALALDTWQRADFFLTSAWPALVLLGLFGPAVWLGWQRHYRSCGLLLAWGVFLFGLLVLTPRGVYAAGWYLQPVLVLLVTCLFGVTVGVTLAVLAVAALVGAATLTPPAVSDAVPGAWAVVAFAGVATALMALLGSMLQRTLDLAISAEEDQNQRMDEARRALRQRENLLRHAMRIDTVGEMASMIVHQLRNQFQLILGYAAVGRRDADATTAAHFRAIAETLGQSNDLLEGLLGMSRSEVGQVDRVDLVELCRRAGDSYRKVLPAKIELEVALPDRPLLVRLNPLGLEHALLNLVINARQAIRGDGCIRIRLTEVDGAACLEVEDTGAGIPEAALSEVFKPFFTTKEKGQGTGLGLAAVQRFVVSSRGQVGVRSQIGEGTVFKLTFPLAGDEIAATG